MSNKPKQYIHSGNDIEQLLNALIRLERNDSIIESVGNFSEKLSSKWYCEQAKIALLNEISHQLNNTDCECDDDCED